jgi:catechol 2,3-dioxygenase-like lactoylglutathione lyase family enzyme
VLPPRLELGRQPAAIHLSHSPIVIRHYGDEPQSVRVTAGGERMKIKLTGIYVDDQDKALAFYTEKLGFHKKADFGNSGYRWLTVVSPEEPDGTELLIEKNDNPAAKAFQQAKYQQGQPAAQFYVDDVQAECDRMKPLGVKFTMEPTKVTGSTIAMLDDTCGNLIQLVQLTGW